MSSDQSVKIDERTEAVASQAIARGYIFLAVALLIDSMYRLFVFREVPWDLLIILIVSSGISTGYMVRHKAWEVEESVRWKMAIISAVALAVFAIVGFIIAMTKTP